MSLRFTSFHIGSLRMIICYTIIRCYTLYMLMHFHVQQIHSSKAATNIKLTANDHWKGCRLNVIQKSRIWWYPTAWGPSCNKGSGQQNTSALVIQNLWDISHLSHLVCHIVVYGEYVESDQAYIATYFTWSKQTLCHSCYYSIVFRVVSSCMYICI